MTSHAGVQTRTRSTYLSITFHQVISCPVHRNVKAVAYPPHVQAVHGGTYYWESSVELQNKTCNNSPLACYIYCSAWVSVRASCGHLWTRNTQHGLVISKIFFHHLRRKVCWNNEAFLDCPEDRGPTASGASVTTSRRGVVSNRTRSSSASL